MTVTTTLDRQYLDGDGSNKNFHFNFRFLSYSQIFVYLVNPDGSSLFQTQNVDYTITGVNASGGGQIVFSVAPFAGTKNVLIRRIVPITQPTSIRNQGAFFPAIHEDAFDRLCMQIQQAQSDANNSLQLDQSGKWWDFNGHRGINAADPVNAQDVATLTWVRSYLATIISAITGPINNALNILFVQRGTGAIPRTVSEKLKEGISTGDFGGAANTVNTVALTAAINEARASHDRSIMLPPGQNNTGVVSNPTGIKFYGGDLVETPDLGNPATFDILSSYADSLGYDLGKEYLYALHNDISSLQAIKIMMFGDSTVVGFGSTTPFTPDGVLIDQALNRGVAGIAINNLAVSGSNSTKWDTAPIIADLTTKTMIVGYGTNDPAVGNEEDFFNHMSAKLSAIRAVRNESSLTIILKGCNSTNDWVNGRSQLWCERLAPVYRKLARLYKCYFFDAYAMYRDSKNGSTWMDTLPYSGIDTHIHPNNFGNMWIWGKLAEQIFPSAISQRLVNNFRNVGSSHTRLLFTATPFSLPYGRSIYRNDTNVNWPSDGIVVNEKSADGVTIQKNYALNRAIPKIHQRNSIGTDGVTWTEWSGVGRNITLLNSWSNAAGRMPAQAYATIDGEIKCRGDIVPGTLTAGTSIFTVTSAIGSGAPILPETFNLPGVGGSLLVSLNTDGSVVILAVTGTPTRVSISGIRYMPS